jgi:transcriptional regulator with XRE-family HTH domain
MTDSSKEVPNRIVSVVRQIRLNLGDTQPKFAKRLGVALRTAKRYELENVLPRNAAIRRNLERLAKQAGVEVEGL